MSRKQLQLLFFLSVTLCSSCLRGETNSILDTMARIILVYPKEKQYREFVNDYRLHQ